MSGYGESRTFETHPGEGGVESEYLGLPFKSSQCEDWYGFGDKRCPNRYEETGDLETDIKSLEKWIGLYGGHGRTGWKVWATNELYKKQAEYSKVLAEQQVIDLSQYTSFGQLVMDYYPLPEAAAEPEPASAIGLVSANVKISFTNSNIGGFSSSIPINDIGELQGLSNASNEWRYTLIGSSTNQPLLTLSGLINMINNLLVSIPEITTDVLPPIEPELEVTTDQVEPPIEPELEVTTADIEPPIEPEVITADLEEAPTEERPVKWIPEPFFSFINEVFRK